MIYSDSKTLIELGYSSLSDVRICGAIEFCPAREQQMVNQKHFQK